MSKYHNCRKNLGDGTRTQGSAISGYCGYRYSRDSIVDQAAIWEMVRSHKGRLYQASVDIDTVEIE